MEKREGGYFISTEEIKQAGKILGIIGIGCLVVGVVGCLKWGAVVWFGQEFLHKKKHVVPR